MAVLRRGPGANDRVRRVRPSPDARLSRRRRRYVPFAIGRYIENTGETTMRFLEMFKSSYYADVSLDQWLALTPPELVSAHLDLDEKFMSSLRRGESPIVPV